jgi:cell division initiation protein
MKLSPNGIKTQQFKRVLRGYDIEEVQAFLERVADETELLQAENETTLKQIEALKEKIKQFRKIEMNLQDTLTNTQESSSKSIEAAKKHSALMIKEAELKAAQIVEKAKENTNELRDSILKLREEKKLLLAKIKAIVDTQTEILSFNKERESGVTSAPDKGVKKVSDDINIDDIVESIL